jgi:iron-sulfur cluster repair protein YtfE (RIC family)
MFHPLLGNLKDVDLDELIKKISELSEKYHQAMRFGNAGLGNQIRMVLNSYQEEYKKRMAEMAEKAKNDKMLKDKVKIKNDRS